MKNNIRLTNKKQKTMKEKENYITPATEAVDVRTEGVICASGDPQDYNNPFGGGEY